MKYNKKLLFVVALLSLLIFCFPVISSAKTIKTTLSVKSNADITSQLQSALNAAKGAKAGNTYEITIPKGKYKIKGTLKIYSNTTLKMNGVTLTRKDETVMLKFGGDGAYKGYTMAKNVKLVGGTWDGAGKNKDIMRFGHGQNLTFSGVTWTNLKRAHHIEIAACNNVLFSGCTFKNHTKAKENKAYEALEIDIMRSEHFDFYPEYDETPCKNITVEGCTFENVDAGMGSHSSVEGCYFSNIVIRNNTFNHIKDEHAIITMNYVDSKITGNKINDCQLGIKVRTTGSSGPYKTITGKKTKITKMNMEISDNEMNIVSHGKNYPSHGISLNGGSVSGSSKLASGKYRMENIIVKNNKIRMDVAGVGVMLREVDNCTVTGNQINCNFQTKVGSGGTAGIYFYDSGSCTVTANTIINNSSAAYSNGIGIHTIASTGSNNIAGNNLENCSIR